MIVTIEHPDGARAYIVDRPLNGWDARCIRQVAGLRFSEILPALAATDTDLHVALAMIATADAGTPMTEEQLLSLPVSAISIDLDHGPPIPADAATDDVVEQPPAPRPGRRSTRKPVAEQVVDVD